MGGGLISGKETIHKSTRKFSSAAANAKNPNLVQRRITAFTEWDYKRLRHCHSLNRSVNSSCGWLLIHFTCGNQLLLRIHRPRPPQIHCFEYVDRP